MKDYNSWTVRTVLAGHKNGLKWKFATYRTGNCYLDKKYHSLAYKTSSFQDYTFREVIRGVSDRNLKYSDTVMRQQGLNLQWKAM